MALFLSALSSSAAVGFGCGSTCGSSASVFLLSYIVTSGKSKRDNLRYVLSFYFGKCLTVTLLCILSSLAGSAILSPETVNHGNLYRLLPAVILIVSTGLLIRVLRHFDGACNTCMKCTAIPDSYNRKETASVWMLMGIGAVYGATPCAPLLLVLGYSAFLSVYGSIVLGILFSISSCITPFILIFGVGNYLSRRLLIQVGEHKRGFQVGVYIFLILMALIFLLFQHR